MSGRNHIAATQRSGTDEVGLGQREVLMGTKPWYQSKGMWAGVIGLGVVIWNAVPTFLPVHLPPIPEWILGVLASIGLYGRATATAKIG